MRPDLRRNPLRGRWAARGTVLGVILSCALSVPVLAQVDHANRVGRAPQAGAPTDWSHRRLVYGNPETREEAARKGSHALEQWNRIQRDPRFRSALARKQATLAAMRGEPPAWARGWGRSRHQPDPDESGVHRDWSYIMGFTTGSGAGGLFPAKYSFDINAAPDCTNDFVVFTTNTAGVAFAAGTAGSKSGTFTNQPTAGGTATITGSGGRSLVLRASGTVNTGTSFQIGANTTITTANLAAAINRNGSAVGVTATTNGATQVTVTAIGPGTSGISVTEALSNFTWAGGNGALAGATGTAGQATILAYNGLYSSCAATYPLPYWSYNTGTGAVANGSPVLSLDGSQVAFIQVSGGVASLVVLKWQAGDGGIVTPTPLTNNGSYPSCTAPCMRVIALNGNPTNTNSDPFYDYVSDVLYVGDDAGVLHKFTGVFGGTPAEVTTSPWPRTISAGNKLSPPVYDWNSGLVFVGSARGAATGGQLHSFDPSTDTLVSSASLSTTTSGGVADSPIVDSSAQKVYVFIGSGIDAANGTTCTTAPCMTVVQFDTGFSAGNAGSRQQVGGGVDSTTTRQLFAGSFDNTYYTSADPANPSGFLYVCGSRSNAASRPTLWRVQITSNALAGATQGPRITSNTATDCSPVTMLVNGSAEYLYASVTANGILGTCAGACLYMWDLNALSSAWSTTTAPNASLAARGGTGGIIVDNISATAGASQIYYSTITIPGNAIQAGQSALQ